jgi:RNA polymerase sigma-70 factor (ECF subfamily)
VGLALQALPPKEQVAFCMLHIDAVPQTEIARILGYSRGYVSKLITRATARLAAAGWEIEP